MLPADFAFSQSSLQDYVDCPRRFYLKHVQRQSWPALEAEPVLEHEIYLREGAEFHRLLHRHALGMPESDLAPLASSGRLEAWWNSYLERGPSGLPELRYPEVELGTMVAEHALLAKYDLVALQAGRRVVIVDWKTSRSRTTERRLAESLQTRVYPFLMVRSGRDLGMDEDVLPEQVEMVYWFSNYPDLTQHFSYSEEQYDSDNGYLTTLIEEIARSHPADFFLTPDDRHCRYCRYRSLCGRGIKAGRLDEDDEWDIEGEPLSDMDLEQIAEIEY
jgi:CRISPR/Cas system-associated exonuclease Cas4 (RecB family)